MTGIDISEGMLAIARARVKKHNQESKVVLHHAGVIEIDQLFDENRFDLITSTLVVSELYGEEREWTLKALHAILKPSGILLVAGEVRPRQFLKRMLYYTLRIPLAILTYLVSQSGTKPVRDLSGEVRKASFEITKEHFSFLGSFVIVVAKRSQAPPHSASESATTPDQDKSPVKSLFDFCGRWFPNPVEPGLRVIGTPGRNAPVNVTGNYHLTVCCAAAFSVFVIAGEALISKIVAGNPS